MLGDAEGRVRALDADGAVLASTSVRRGLVFLAPHRDGHRVWLVAQQSGELWCWDPPTGAREGPFLNAKLNPPSSVAHLAGGRLLLATGWNNPPRAFDPDTRDTATVTRFTASHVAATAGGRVVVATGTDLANAAAAATVHLLVLAPDGKTVAWSRPDPAGTTDASALALRHDGRVTVVGFQNGAVSVWDLEARRLLWTFRDHTDVVRGLAIAPDGLQVASASRQGHLVVRRLGVDRPQISWRSGDATFYSLAFADDHTLVSTGSGRTPALVVMGAGSAPKGAGAPLPTATRCRSAARPGAAAGSMRARPEIPVTPGRAAPFRGWR